MSQDWDRCYREGNIHWNRGEASPPLVQYLREHPLSGRVLVPGCGLGHDAAHIADAGADVVALDIAPTALEMARQHYPHLDDACWFLGDLFDLPQEWRGRFDYVVEHTCLSGLHPSMRPQYREALTSVLKPGGMIVGVWFINPDLDPEETGPPFGIPVEELDSLFAGDFDVVADYVPDLAFPGREGRERLRVLKKRTIG